MGDNIRVAVRVRPLIQRELRKNDASFWNVKEQKTISQLNCSSVSYSFDRVFDGLENNELVYEEICSPIVKYVLQGFNGTIFAYGQTSSGKTYTMLGEEAQNTSGVLHHTVSEIFDSIQNMPEREFLPISVSFMEIYNEKIRDLLVEDKRNDNLKIQEHKDGLIQVAGLTEVPVQSLEQVLALMRKGEKRRHIGETLLNQRSSRSHSIFRMNVISRMKGVEDAAANISQLNLVDLAGSERVDQAGTTGARFKESVHINKSLFVLSSVISQLSEQQDFVNFRDSKLTRLLQNSLGGNALTAIICTVTPASLEETLSTLKFASRAKTIKNQPHVNEIKADQSLVKRYENDLKLLTEKLKVSEMQNKKLEEKNKQNEALKQQIEDLKAKFVAQLIQGARDMRIQKINRRETWGGHLMSRKLRASICTPRKKLPYADLPTLDEDPDAEIESAFPFDLEVPEESLYGKISSGSERSSYDKISHASERSSYDKISHASERSSLFRHSSMLQKLEDAAVQTDFFPMMENIAIQTEGDSQKVENTKSQNSELEKDSSRVNVGSKSSEKCSCEFYEKYHTISEYAKHIENELSELQYFTNMERQVTFHDLNEMSKVIEERLQNAETYGKNVAELEAIYEAAYEARKADLNTKTELLVKDLEDKYEQEMANQENKLFEEMKTKLTELKEKHMKEIRDKEEVFRNEILELESIHKQELIYQENEFNKHLEEKISEVKFEYELQYSIKNDGFKMKIKELEQAHEMDKKQQETKFMKDINAKNKDFEIKMEELKSAHELQMRSLESKLIEHNDNYIRQESERTKELEQKIVELEEVNKNTIFALKAEHEKKLKDLELQTNTQVSTNQELKNKLDNNKREMFATKMKYEALLDTCKRKFEKIKKNHELDKQELHAKTKEIEDLKAKIKDQSSSLAETRIQQLQAKVTDITNEKDSIFKEASALKQQFAELQNNFKKKEDELFEEDQRIRKEFNLEIKAMKEKNKALLCELDQKKAKITTLEHNNSTLVRELRKSKEHSSKHSHPVTSKTETATQNSVKKIQQYDHNLHSGKKEAETRSVEKPEAILLSSQSENVQGFSPDLPEHEKALLVGGSGPVNWFRTMCLEKELKTKDKEIYKLRKELCKLQSLFPQEKLQAVANVKTDKELKQPLRIVEDITNEYVTQKIHSDLHPYPPGTIPQVMPKGILKKENVKYVPNAFDELENKLPTKRAPESVSKSKPDGMKLIAGECDVPNCKQQ